jgi:hypothetical protein
MSAAYRYAYIDQVSLVRVDEAAAADWIGARLARFGTCVTAVVPAGFAAYARIPNAYHDQSQGNLAPRLLSVLCGVLRGHTSTPDDCRFCLWDGYGGITDRSGTVVALPYRSYLVFRGDVAEAIDLGWQITPTFFDPQAPNLFWPADQAWCVATEIDLYATYVGGSAELVAAILAERDLDAQPADPDGPIGAAAGE